MRPLLPSVAAALACAAALPAQAQQAFDLGEVVFSANFAPTPRNRTGASITIIGSEELRHAGDSQVSTLLSRVPGVGVVHSGGPGQPANLRMRGSDPRYVAVLVDGVRVDDPTGIATEFDFRHMGAADIGRIEVLRGSQSAVYGGSAIAGVVDITGRRPEADGFSQSFDAEYGRYNTRRAAWSMAFRDDRFQAALTLSHDASDGFSAFDTLPPDPTLNPDGWESNRLSLWTRYQVSEDVAIGASVFVQRARADFDDFGADADNLSKRREIGGRVFAEIVTGDVRHDLDVTRYEITRDLFSPGFERYEGTRTTASYQASVPAAPDLTLIFGADYTRDTAVTPSDIRNATRVAGIFGQALWAPRDDLDLSLVARVDRDSEFGTFPTGRLAMAWQAADGVTLRGALARGYLTPSSFQRFGEPLFAIGPNPNLTPERSLSAEIGADVDFAGGAVLSATAFYIAVDNRIDFVFGAPSTYQNLPGRSPRRGLELAGEVPLGEGYVLGASYTYTDARRPDGTRAPRVPRHDLTLTLDAALTDRLQGSLSLHHVAGRPDDGFPAVAMPDYTLLNVGLRHALTDQIDLNLRVENLFNARYQQVQGYGTSGRAAYIGLSSRF